MELTAYIGLKELDYKIHYWRTKTGHEVDFITEDGDLAIEVKISDNPRKTDYKGLLTYCTDHKPRSAILVCLVSEARKTSEGIVILPWKKFLTDLWDDKIMK